MTLRIVTDSSCDLPQTLVDQHGVTVVPIFVQVGENAYRDGIDITRAEFYERLPHFKPPATTAAPGPELFKQTYERLANDGATEILSIHISHTLSATVTNAQKAAEETSIVPVTVLDSRQLSMGVGFQVLTAAQEALKGTPLKDVLAKLDSQIRRTRTFAGLDTLDYLYRSGRMNFALAKIGTLLQIKPFLKMYDGVSDAERVRTHKGAIKRLIELLYASGPYEKAAMLYSGARDRAEELFDEVRHLLPTDDFIFGELNPALGVHLGPGVLGFSTVSAKQEG